ncbi:MAG: sulfatase-like hydrolase/transferase [Lentisphaeraceae bacterium]|nr:sulfatase-like hydrolase/transferase [Lentisphaeraceae bacterium]
MKPFFLLSFIFLNILGATERPNILFIITDQHFADAVSHVIGDKHIKTPNLDKLASKSMQFTKAYAPNPLCIPARNSLFTGQYPFQLKIQSNSDKKKLSKKLPFMGKIFKNAGYRTGYYGKWHINLPVRAKELHGFQEMGALKSVGLDHAVPAPAINFMNEKSDKPFLLVTSFTSAHDICQLCRGDKLPSGPIGDLPEPHLCPPAPINIGSAHDETDTIKEIRDSYGSTKLIPVKDFDANKWRQMRWGYYRLIERTDKYIGQVLDSLEKSNLDENTLIIFTADHGDCTGAHGFGQKTVFYDESARIPFYISFKNKIPVASSQKLINVGIDTLPTMLDFAGIKTSHSFLGKSIKEITDNPESSWRDHIVISNQMIQGETHFKPKGRMLRSKSFKYSIYNLGKHRESLIDMVKDPHEMKNLARNPEYKTILEEHRSLLQKYIKETGDTEAQEIVIGK